MCGRSRVSLNRQQIAAAAYVQEDVGADAKADEASRFTPSFNFAPGHDAPIVFCGADGSRKLRIMRWGLVSHLTSAKTKPDHFRMFNARSETVAEKVVFSQLLRSRRGIFVCNGWYEWLKQGSSKRPYYVHVGEHRVLMMAALYDEWRQGKDDQPLYTFTILTTDASDRLSWLHNRMPVVLPTDDAVKAWLSGKPLEDREFNQRIAVSYNGEDLQWHEVTPELGKLSTQGPQCCKPLKKGPGIAAFFAKAGKAAETGPDSKPADSFQDAGVAQPSTQHHQSLSAHTVEQEKTAGLESTDPNAIDQQKEDAESAAAPKQEGADDVPFEESGVIKEEAAGQSAVDHHVATEEESHGLSPADALPSSTKGSRQHIESIDPAAGPSVPLNPDDNLGKSDGRSEEYTAQEQQTSDLPRDHPASPSKHSHAPKRKSMSSQLLSPPKRNPSQRTRPSEVPGQRTMNNFFTKTCPNKSK